MEKVVAVVVSYNRQGLLSECIQALRAQTRKPDEILVVNNGSTDNTEQWLSTQPDIKFITQANLGSGGGFSTGIQWAFKNNFTWIWCMDDDGYPAPEALQRLLDHDSSDRSLMNCAVVSKDDRESFVWKTGGYTNIHSVNEPVIKNAGHPFNGTLIHRAIVERVGVPNPAYFLWGDETEYYYRIVRQNKIPVFTVTSAIHYHPPAAFNYKDDWNFSSSWKMYYYVRNRYHIHLVKFNNKLIALVNYLCFIAAFAGIILVFQRTDRLKKLRSIVRPVADAFTNNFTATPSLILQKLNNSKNVQSRPGVLNTAWWNIFQGSPKHAHNTSAAA